MQVIVERCGGTVRLQEYPRSVTDAFRQYRGWVEFYEKAGGFTMITINLPNYTQSTRVAGGITSVIRDAPLC